MLGPRSFAMRFPDWNIVMDGVSPRNSNKRQYSKLCPMTIIEAHGMTDIVDNKAAHRYELAIDGHIAAAYYVLSGNVITFTHTEVPAALGGKGIGSTLIKGALDQVRALNLRVVPQCPFVKAYIDKHPGYADLVG
jgi:predicted GNAT family acetyltransferase